MQLILYTLRPVQEPMIYLEDKGGLIRDYSITIIIDNSKSCFSDFNDKHSYLTIINLLKIIKEMAVSSFDLIITNSYNENPHILIFNKPSILIFKDDALYEQLLILLNNPIYNTDLGDSIHAAYDLKKKKKYDRESYLFILSDGLSHKKDEDEIIYYSNKCLEIGMKVYGIGLGIYPCKMKQLFGTFLYSANPEHLLKALSKIFGKIIKTENELSIISENDQLNKNLDEIFSKLERNKKFVYIKLRKELEDIIQGDDVLNLFCNKEKKTYDSIKMSSFNVEKGHDLEIYSKNLLKTQKILIVMLWSYELNEKGESPYVHPMYINKGSKINEGYCLKTCIDFFGIEDYIVVDYDNAIKELLKKNEKGECIYYSVWILCGPKYPILPPINGKKNPTDPYLVEEFINILIKFWTNGGSLIFFADGDPLHFQVNLFLEKVEFNNKKPEFKISGDYIGNNILEQDKTGELKKNGIFDKSNKKSYYKGKEIQRQSLSHNLGLIYEGYTISYAVDKDNKRITIKEKQKLNPFKPFSINSEGGISTLIYEADKEGRGDIIIDCGYTKLFLNLYKTQTFRFIQNIAGWTARPEIHYMIEGINPWDWRPKGIDYKVNYNLPYKEYLNLEENNDINNMKILFAIDGSYSTDSEFYRKELSKIINKYFNKERGDIIYNWGSEIEKLTKEKLLYYAESGSKYYGGTLPKLIAKIIDQEKESKCKHLMIITDGSVSDENIKESDEEMNRINYNFDYVSVYIIGSGDLSVGAPFCRKTPNKTYYKADSSNYFKELITLNKEEIKTLDEIEKYDNYDDFMNNYNKILNAVQAKCIGTSGNKELELKINSIIKTIIKKNNLIDMDSFNQKTNTLIQMTKGSLLKAFTLDKINAAISNYDYHI